MAGAKAGLDAVVMKALGANKGYLAVSALPAVEAGPAVVKITLVKGESWKELTERLD